MQDEKTTVTLPTQQWQASDLADFSKVQEMGKQLNHVIKEFKLYTMIQAKQYVQVEGWQFAGTMLGLSARTAEISNHSYWDQANGKWVYEYEAKVEIINAITGQVVGCGFAICSNVESNKKSYERYAIASMAQTRAVSKGYRNILSWVVKCAGFETTPAEEMEGVNNAPQQPQQPVQPINRPTQAALDVIAYYFSVPFMPLAETAPLKARYDQALANGTLTAEDTAQLASILNAMFYKHQPQQTMPGGKEKTTMTEHIPDKANNDLPF